MISNKCKCVVDIIQNAGFILVLFGRANAKCITSHIR